MRPHISINVSDVTSSVEFYEKVFNQKPQKQNADYAKFDLENPSLNFSMQSNDKLEVSKVNHFGIEVQSSDEVMQWQKKLTETGILKLVESDTKCCFARQDKVWFQDPDGNSWEVFYVHEQLPVTEKSPKSSCCG
jgi:catechol 2,3-dioxygenase-like lactoylglutathione lyase family enzyme